MNLGTIVRIAAILLGIGSATLLAHSAFGIRFNEHFLLFLKLVENTIGVLVLPFELLIVNPAVRWLHEQGWVFDFREHWKNVFVLLWLFFAADLRTRASTYVVMGNYGFWESARAISQWLYGAFIALVGGALAGTSELDKIAVFWWSVMAYFLWSGGNQVLTVFYPYHSRWLPVFGAIELLVATVFLAFAIGWAAPLVFDSRSPSFLWAIVAFFSSKLAEDMLTGHYFSTRNAWHIALVAISGALVLGVISPASMPDLNATPSPGLANLTAFVVTLAVWNLSIAAWLLNPRNPYGYIDRLRNNPESSLGLDVLSVLGCSALIVGFAHLLA